MQEKHKLAWLSHLSTLLVGKWWAIYSLHGAHTGVDDV